MEANLGPREWKVDTDPARDAREAGCTAGYPDYQPAPDCDPERRLKKGDHPF